MSFRTVDIDFDVHRRIENERRLRDGTGKVAADGWGEPRLAA